MSKQQPTWNEQHEARHNLDAYCSAYTQAVKDGYSPREAKVIARRVADAAEREYNGLNK